MRTESSSHDTMEGKTMGKECMCIEKFHQNQKKGSNKSCEMSQIRIRFLIRFALSDVADKR